MKKFEDLTQREIAAMDDAEFKAVSPDNGYVKPTQPIIVKPRRLVKSIMVKPRHFLIPILLNILGYSIGVVGEGDFNCLNWASDAKLFFILQFLFCTVAGVYLANIIKPK